MTNRTVRFLAVDRNEAKQVFQTKDPVALAQLIDSLWHDTNRKSANRNLDLGLTTAAYTSFIEASTVLDKAAKSLLTSGARQLASEAGTEIYLLRPDLVGPLSMTAHSIPQIGDFLTSIASRAEAVLIYN